MPQLSGSELAKARSRVGVATRRGTPADVLEARRELAAAQIARYVEKVVGSAPPLTPAQRSRITALLGSTR